MLSISISLNTSCPALSDADARTNPLSVIVYVPSALGVTST